MAIRLDWYMSRRISCDNTIRYMKTLVEKTRFGVVEDVYLV